MPVLAIGGAASFGENVGNAVRVVADDVQSVVIPGVGHFVAEEAPDEMLAALTAFLAPHRDGSAAVRDPQAARCRCVAPLSSLGWDLPLWQGPDAGGSSVLPSRPGSRS